MIEAVENWEVERVVTSAVSRLSRSVRDFADAVDRIVDTNKVALHVLDMGIDLDPKNPDHYTRAFLYSRRDVRRARGRDQTRQHSRGNHGEPRSGEVARSTTVRVRRRFRGLSHSERGL